MDELNVGLIRNPEGCGYESCSSCNGRGLNPTEDLACPRCNGSGFQDVKTKKPLIWRYSCTKFYFEDWP